MARFTLQINRGVTLIETIFIVAIVGVLVGIGTISFLNAQSRATRQASVDTVIADIKSQQIKAMVGDTEGRTAADDYGIYFGTESYTLFHGETYTASDPTNIVVDLPDNAQFYTITFPGRQIIFLQGSGEIAGFVGGSSSIVVRDADQSDQKTIIMNRYGVVTGVY